MARSIELRKWIVALECSSVVVVGVGVHRWLAKLWWRARRRRILLLGSIVHHVGGIVVTWELFITELRRWGASGVGGRGWVEDLAIVSEGDGNEEASEHYT